MQLDPVATGLLRHLRAIAAADKAMEVFRDIVGYSDVILLFPNTVSLTLLKQNKTSHLFTARWLRDFTGVLNMLYITVLQQVCYPRPDLQKPPLTNPDLVVLVDGSASRDQRTGHNKGGFAVSLIIKRFS